MLCKLHTVHLIALDGFFLESVVKPKLCLKVSSYRTIWSFVLVEERLKILVAYSEYEYSNDHNFDGEEDMDSESNNPLGEFLEISQEPHNLLWAH